MDKGRILLTALLLALGAGPVEAGTGMTIPEPTDLTLLALGLAGVLIGRRAAKRPPAD